MYKAAIVVFLIRALSSVGRASALQAECRRFDPVSAHHNFSNLKIKHANLFSVFAFLLFLFLSIYFISF